MVVVESAGWVIMHHTSNCLFILCYSAKNSLLFHHIFVPLVEDDPISIISDESNGSFGDSELENMR